MLPVLIYQCHAPLALVWNVDSAAYCQLDGIMRGRHASNADALVPCISCVGMRHAFSSFRRLDKSNAREACLQCWYTSTMHLLHWHEACIQQFTIPLVELCKGGMPLVLVHRCHASLTLAWDKYLIPLLSPWWVSVGEPSSLDLYAHMHLQSRLFRFSILMYAFSRTC